jgi:hypothetical protein
MIAAGAASSTTTTSWPSLTNVKLLLLGVNQSAFSSSQISDMRTMLSGGGTIVVVGEHATYNSGHHANLNSVLASLGANSRLNNATSYDAGCTQTATTVTSNTWTTGTSSMNYAYSSNISVGSGASVLYRGRSGQALAVSEGSVNVLVWSDSNAFGGCSYSSDTQRAWRNLYTGGCTATTWYRDADGDSWGGSTSTSACVAPSGYVARTGDCNDSSASIFPGATEVVADGIDQSCDGREVCYFDTDNDGWRLTTTFSSADADCSDSGEALASEPTLDCNDSVATIYPGATETVGDGVDQSCDGTEVCFVDVDNDGWRLTTTVASSDVDCSDSGEALASEPTLDCNDAVASINPGATEVVGDEVDQTCDGQEVCFNDVDDDGWRLTSTRTSSDADCVDAGEARASEPTLDCDDTDRFTFPGATEVVADGKDQSCDGREVCYNDTDDDGWRLTTTLTSVDADCADTGEALASEPTLDCDDSDRFTFPGATETIADEKDQSCDGREICYVDADGDAWRLDTTTTSSDADCRDSGEASRSIPRLDCDDSDRATYPGATEVIGDGKDQSCDGREDCYADADDDGYRVDTTVSSVDADCLDAGEGLASDPRGDCDDADKATYPGATELVADGKDQSCDGSEICYEDLDLDRYRTSVETISLDADCADSGEALASLAADDCDDADAATYPGAFEVVADEKDQSCDGREICYVDADDDTWRIDVEITSADADCSDSGEGRAVDPDGDCDDDDASVYPGATEVPYDGIDQDCTGEDLCDVDLDGYDADAGSCFGSDCDDDDAAINPAAPEVWYDGIDADCDAASDYDADRDGFDSADYGGEDCDDTDDLINPDVDEVWYDGVDANCDEWSDFDQDGDGFDSADYGGEDCDDLDETVYPGAEELADGIDNDCDGVDETVDSDGDGLPDEIEFDLGTDPTRADSDGDGLWDGDEVGDDLDEPADTDADGVIDALDTDDDGDGLPTRIEVGDPSDPRDSDGDGTPDYLDLDSDDDGFDDEVEGLVDSDRDGTPDYLDLDSDDDSVLDEAELPGDTDKDERADRVDPDDDADGWATLEEESWENQDLDGDGLENYLDPDADGDGTDDVDEGTGDRDCDAIPNVQDSNDFDGPCATANGLSYQSAACPGSDNTGGTAGWLGIMAAWALLLRRRRVA